MTNKSQAQEHPAGSVSRLDVAGDDASAARFSQKELRQLSFELSARWFSLEPDPRLTLSVVHPWRLHAYWHISPPMMKEALADTAAPQALVIRFTDLTPGQAGPSTEVATFDVEVDGLDNSWYVDLWQSDRRYIAVLGLRGADGTLHAFVRSNEIQVPRAEPSTALEFTLGQYRGAKPFTQAPDREESAYSVAHLAGLLPPSGDFPDVHADIAGQTIVEPDFPGAPLVRAQDWEQAPVMDDSGASRPERRRFGSEFPVAPIETTGLATADGGESPVDHTAVPELPEIDAQTVSESLQVSASVPLPSILTPEEAGAETGGNPTTEAPQAMPLERNFPEVRADIVQVDDIDKGSRLSAYGIDGAVGERDHSASDTSMPHRDGRSGSFPSVTGKGPGAYHGESRRVPPGVDDKPRSDAPTPIHRNTLQGHEGMQATSPSTGRTKASDEHRGPGPHALTGPAPNPVIRLEEAIAASCFSATPDEPGLNLSVQFELSGTSGTDQLLTLFGEPVLVDEQGRFSVRIPLNKGPRLAAFLRAQRRNRSEHH